VLRHRRQSTQERTPLRLGEFRKIGERPGVAPRQLLRRSGEGEGARAQHVVRHGKAELVRCFGVIAEEDFRGGVFARALSWAWRVRTVSRGGEPVIRQFRRVADEQDVIRLHIAVLEADLASVAQMRAGIQAVERLSNLPEVEADERWVDVLAELVVEDE